ncbi:hypothetical protein BJV77DRAFT_971214 [Russula vinacea]|nr:hypothetical protein BJV77DRAFT_971214 [Russula vinacea]
MTLQTMLLLHILLSESIRLQDDITQFSSKRYRVAQRLHSLVYIPVSTIRLSEKSCDNQHAGCTMLASTEATSVSSTKWTMPWTRPWTLTMRRTWITI